MENNSKIVIDTQEQALAEARKRIVQLETALRDCMNNFNMTRLIMPPDAAKQAAEIIADYRTVLADADKREGK